MSPFSWQPQICLFSLPILSILLAIYSALTLPFYPYECHELKIFWRQIQNAFTVPLFPKTKQLQKDIITDKTKLLLIAPISGLNQCLLVFEAPKIHPPLIISFLLMQSQALFLHHQDTLARHLTKSEKILMSFLSQIRLTNNKVLLFLMTMVNGKKAPGAVLFFAFQIMHSLAGVRHQDGHYHAWIESKRTVCSGSFRIRDMLFRHQLSDISLTDIFQPVIFLMDICLLDICPVIHLLARFFTPRKLLVRHWPVGHLPFTNLPVGHLPFRHILPRHLPVGNLPFRHLPVDTCLSDICLWTFAFQTYVAKTFAFQTFACLTNICQIVKYAQL